MSEGSTGIAVSIRAVELMTGGTVSFIDSSGRISPVVGRERCPHRHHRCQLVKSAAGARCSTFDLNRCARHAKPGRGFWKVCHGGIAEAVQPVEDQGVVLGLVMIGAWQPWRDGDMLMDRQAPFHQPLGPDVPRLAVEQREAVMALLHLLAREVARLAISQPSPGESRRDRILRLVRDFAHVPLTVGELAADLGLSPSRAGHLVQDLFGRSLADLVLSRRLELARSLLADEGLSLEEVARRSGFSGRSHLHRRFFAVEGITPGAWRRQRASARR